MMIIKNNRGAAMVWAMAFVVMCSIVSFGFLSGSFEMTRATKKEKEDANSLMSAHSMASLFKSELEEQFRTKFKQGAWNGCSPSGTFTEAEFLTALENPPAPNCVNQTFTFRYFKVSGGNNTVTLGAFKTSNYVLDLPWGAQRMDNLNGFQYSMKAADFNSGRGLIFMDLNVKTHDAQKASGTGAGSNRTLKMVVDLGRTVATPSHSGDCNPCHAVIGSVCCGRNVASTKIIYLESGSGRVMEAIYDSAGAKVASVAPLVPAVGPFPILESLKAADQAVIKKYRNDGFCVPGIQSGTGPVLYVIDAATGKWMDGAAEKESDIYLTTHGYFYQSYQGAAFTKLPIDDPKIVSIAYGGGEWWLLRSDGQVLTAKYINQKNTWTAKPGLKLLTAYKLSMGAGPCPCASNPYHCN